MSRGIKNPRGLCGWLAKGTAGLREMEADRALDGQPELKVDILKRFCHSRLLFPKVKDKISRVLISIFGGFLVQKKCQYTHVDAQNSNESIGTYVYLGAAILTDDSYYQAFRALVATVFEATEERRLVMIFFSLLEQKPSKTIARFK